MNATAAPKSNDEAPSNPQKPAVIQIGMELAVLLGLPVVQSGEAPIAGPPCRYMPHAATSSCMGRSCLRPFHLHREAAPQRSFTFGRETRESITPRPVDTADDGVGSIGSADRLTMRRLQAHLTAGAARASGFRMRLGFPRDRSSCHRMGWRQPATPSEGKRLPLPRSQ
jgi:hypothetical protein